MRLHYRPGGFSKIPSRWGYFYADRGLSQTSAQASPATAILPAAIPPQNHLVTCRNCRGFNFYRGERIWNCWWRQYDWQLRKFPYTCILLSVSRVRTTNTMIRLRMHRLIRTCPFGGNLHLAGPARALTRMRKQTFSMFLKYHKDDKSRY